MQQDALISLVDPQNVANFVGCETFDIAQRNDGALVWRQDYNWRPPHWSLGALTPKEFADQQGAGPLEQVGGCAARPLALPPQGQDINRLY